jgi:hypothetical protein
VIGAGRLAGAECEQPRIERDGEKLEKPMSSNGLVMMIMIHYNAACLNYHDRRRYIEAALLGVLSNRIANKYKRNQYPYIVTSGV